jgi:HSP20 family molecular chaperone IbpA
MPRMRLDDVLDPFVSLSRELDRLFDEFFNDFGRGLRRRGAGTPMIDVAETDKELVVTAELPGLAEKDFEVTLSGDLVTIKAEKKAEQWERKATLPTWNAGSVRSHARSDCPSRSATRRSTHATTRACSRSALRNRPRRSPRCAGLK